MAHYAKIDASNTVVDIIVAEADFLSTFVDNVQGEWLQCSYNTRGGIHYEPNSNTPSVDQTKALRKNYPGVGYTYDRGLDAFVPPKPFKSWLLNPFSCLWEAPIQKPDTENLYWWDEEKTLWVLVNESAEPEPTNEAKTE